MTDPTGNALLARIKQLERENKDFKIALTGIIIAWLGTVAALVLK